MESFNKNETIVWLSPYPGSNFNACIQEATEYCVTNKIDIRFTFNGKTYEINYMDIIDNVYTKNGVE